MRSGSTLVTDTIGVLSPRPTMPRRRDMNDPAAPISCRMRQQLCVPGALRAQRLAGDDALRMPGHRDRRRAVQIEALPDERANRGDLGEQDAGARDGDGRQLFGRGQRLLGGQRADPLHRFEADRPHDDELAGHGLEEQCGLTDDLAQLGFDACRADELLEVLQPGAALAAECHGVGLTGVQPIDERVCGGMASPRRD